MEIRKIKLFHIGLRKREPQLEVIQIERGTFSTRSIW